MTALEFLLLLYAVILYGRSRRLRLLILQYNMRAHARVLSTCSSTNVKTSTITILMGGTQRREICRYVFTQTQIFVLFVPYNWIRYSNNIIHIILTRLDYRAIRISVFAKRLRNIFSIFRTFSTRRVLIIFVTRKRCRSSSRTRITED